MKRISEHKLSFWRLLVCVFFWIAASELAAQVKAGRIVMDLPGYPLVFELNAGEMHTFKRSHGDRSVERSIEVLSVEHFKEPNLWFSGDLLPQNYSCARVVVNISGERVTLLHRPYESPKLVNGLRIYIEATKEWAHNAELADMKDVKKQVRLSVCLQGEPWGPGDLVFPIRNYRWRSAVYNNTWSSLVPYNKLYYHRGEDYGAIPDILDVVSPAEGKVIQTPLPDGDGKSNAVIVQNHDSVLFRISHMNVENIIKDNALGATVKPGTILGKTGMTWAGRKSQVNDPHCHIDIGYKGTMLASFPYLIEAYFRMYGDPVLAVAGGYQFTTVGRKVTLDGNRSIPRPGEAIKSYVWRLHNGEVLHAPVATIQYARPGVYTEELIVVTVNGHEDRDFVQVRVYDDKKGRGKMAYGWAYYSPLREIAPGTNVLFWNRLTNTKAPVAIDFGDGSPSEIIEKALGHAYQRTGCYTVTLSSFDEQENPITLKLEVKVE